jgi:hypothetical protein
MMRRGRVLLLLVCCASAASPALRQLGTDLEGRPVNQLATSGSRAVVLFFAASDCPISNRYIPEIERLNREFTGDGVRFWWVYPNPDDTAEIVRRHDQQYDLQGNVVLDTQQQLTALAHARITPEVAVFVPKGAGLREVYRGENVPRPRGMNWKRRSAPCCRIVLFLQPAVHPWAVRLCRATNHESRALDARCPGRCCCRVPAAQAS